MSRAATTRTSLPLSLYAVAIILVTSAACYWPAIHGSALWDDLSHITRPGLRSLSGLAKIWAEPGATQQYYPVLHSAFWIESQIFGDATTGYHFVNLLLHVTAGCLFACAIRAVWSLGGSAGTEPPRGAEWLAAFIFAIHPICVESVAWISEQKNTLSLTFYLLSAITYVRFRTTDRWQYYWLAFALFLLALGSKTVTASLPAALLVVLWWRKGHLRLREDVLPLVPWFVIALAAGITTTWVEKHFIGASGAAFDLSMADRVLRAARVLWHYVMTVFWPRNLIFFYPSWNASQPGVIEWLSLIAAVGVTVILWLLTKFTRGPFAAWLLFVGGLFPALGFVNVYPFKFSYVADHFQYLPDLSIFTLLGYGFAISIRHSRRITLALGAAAAIVLVSISRMQAALYLNNETLFKETLARSPSSWEAHNIIGALRRDQGRSDDAINEFQASIKLEPDDSYAHLALGTELARQPGNKPQALAEMRRAIAPRPTYAEAHNTLGLEMQAQGDISGAKKHFETAIKFGPKLAEAHYNLGQLYEKIPERSNDAMSEFEAAIRVRPYYAPAHAHLANMLVGLGKLGEAIPHFRMAVQADPNVAWVHRNLAMALAQIPAGLPEAIDECKAAIRLNPGDAESLNALGILYAEKGDLNRAEAEWLEALRLNPNNEGVRRNLGRLNLKPH